MKTLWFKQRLRRAPHAAIGPIGGRPFRLWMTGSLAVVMAAVVPIRDVSDAERPGGMRLLRHSRFGVGETLHRIEGAVLDHGLSVLALMPGVRPVLVLRSSVGGTPVVMEHADSPLAMPLSVMIREGLEGGADVLVAASSTRRAALAAPDLPAAVLDELAALPRLVDRALL